MAPHGRIHILVVYAEMKFDSVYGHLDPVKDPKGTIGWKVGKLPNWKQWLVSKTPEEDAWMTRYFRQASFGKFQVTGDVLDTLITIPISSVRDGRGKVVESESFAGNFYRQAVLSKLNSIKNPQFLFGSQLSDFDRWTYGGTGLPSTEKPNSKYDMVMIVWRNIHVVGSALLQQFDPLGLVDVGLLKLHDPLGERVIRAGCGLDALGLGRLSVAEPPEG